MSDGNPARFTDQDIEAVRRGFSTDHGRYIALMDLSHLLSNDNMEALLPAAEAVLNRPLTAQINPSMVELPTTSRNLDLDSLAPPAPPLPRMMKNLLKDRRRFQRQLVTTTTPQLPEFDEDVVTNAHKSVENYQLTRLFKSESASTTTTKSKTFSSDLLLATLLSKDSESNHFLKPEMEFKLKKKE